MKNFKLILKSLISNHACVEGGRRKPWYFAVIIFFFAMLLSLIPIFVQTYTREGDTPVATNAYQMDVSSQRFVEELNKKNIEMKIINGQLTVNGKVDDEEWNKAFTDKDPSGNNCYIHQHLDAYNKEYYADLGVYYIPSVKLTDDKYRSITSFPSTNADGEAITVNRNYSFIIFTEKSVSIYIYAKSAGKSVGSINGDFKHVEEGFTVNSLYNEDLETAWSNWKTFYRRAYDSVRLELAWKTPLVMLAVNAGISIFMGFMLWVLTRGKNNLNWFGIWETQKIVAWSTLSPAILTTGLGFLIASFSQVMFPLLLGVRIMWLSMKLLRPENKDIYPPLKEDKVVNVKPVK